MRVNLDIQSLRSFLKVAELGSFTRAAQVLSLTQPAISQQIRRLEDLLGVELFARDNRQVLLTLEGERLTGYAQQLVSVNDKVGVLFDVSRTQESVTLGIPEYFCEEILQRVIPVVALELPSVRIVVKVARSALLAEAFNDGLVDVGLMIGELPRVAGVPLHALSLKWLGGELAVAPFDGEEVALALFKAPCVFRSLAIRRLEESGIRWRCVYESEDLMSLRSAVQAGVGVTLLPWLAEVPGLKNIEVLAHLPVLPEFAVELKHRAGWEPWYKSQLLTIIEAAWRNEYGVA
ncbi:LysR family transcriptional regulator [Pseudomonas sp. MAFF 212408]|uniref:LysR family transcriptional regulator n=1 Tax=Pseudomonas kitaguniensis TaxID=2607908 RepID=A0A5N7KL75_9PSED|nr:LysR family transcriptional regulator [Pseudomonas kitaguniensis]MPR02790.1 LysR family transcriptional regulator [Pseudomonas kitaguniensis]